MAEILIVDDRPLNRQFLTTLLGYYGHSLSEAADGREALERVRNRRPDLVVSDIVMPTMDGQEFVRRMREDPANASIPVIFYTATYRAREARTIANDAGVRWVLPKPCEPAQILAAVYEALGEPFPSARTEPAVQEAAPGLAKWSLAERLEGVEQLNLHLAQLLEHAMKLTEKQGGSLAALKTLEEALEGVQALGLRLASLIEVGIQLSAEREPSKLLDLFCRAAQDMLTAKFSGVAILGADGRVEHFVSKGLDAEAHARVAPSIAQTGEIARMLAAGRPVRLTLPDRRPEATGLPETHPPIGSFLAVPLLALGQAHGWLYAAERLGASAFSVDDERIASAIASQLAVAWANMSLYEKLEAHAAQLQREVAEREHAEKEVRRLNEDLERRVAKRTSELEAANKELEAFSYSVSHDLRAPLRAIEGFASIVLRDQGAKLPEQYQRYLGIVSDNTRQMAQLIEDLLKFAQTARQPVAREPIVLQSFVKQCLGEYRDETANRQVKVTVDTLPDCRADPALLKQVFVNLLGNALKYTRKQPHPAIEIGCRSEDGQQVIYVKDNGAGFDMKYAGKLFGVFQRLHHKDDFEGTGVGLAIVQRIVHRHGGRVWAEAAPEKGATFYFTLGEAER